MAINKISVIGLRFICFRELTLRIGHGSFVFGWIFGTFKFLFGVLLVPIHCYRLANYISQFLIIQTNIEDSSWHKCCFCRCIVFIVIEIYLFALKVGFFVISIYCNRIRTMRWSNLWKFFLLIVVTLIIYEFCILYLKLEVWISKVQFY